MGRIKQIRFFLILLGPGTSVSDGLRQEAFWKGGNKNELNVVLGVSKEGKPEWAHVFSWTPVESLKVDIREAVFETKSLAELTTKIVSLAEEKWVRKSFSEFSYLTVNPPKHAIYFTFFLAVVVNFLSAVWVINNEY